MKISTKLLSTMSIVAIMALSGCGGSDDSSSNTGSKEGADTSASITAEQSLSVLTTYSDIALAVYTDTLTTAQALKTALQAFVDNPTEGTLTTAKDAWKVSREPYLQSEAYRLSNGPIDGEEGWVADAYGALEGQLNAWPLDENMIDYTTDANGAVTSGNIIDTIGLFTPTGGDAVDVTTITADALTALNENGGDANVATGYHAIEFLLWGQDQDYQNGFVADGITNGPLTAGQRVLEDYTSNANADRRKEYLMAAVDKMIADITTVRSAWVKETSTNCTVDASGCYRAALLGELTGDDASKNISAEVAIKDIMIGMGVFLKSEVANERIAVAVLTPSEEDEHSCFSDNTHRDIYGDIKGFENVLKGEYGEISASDTLSFYDLASTSTKADIDAIFTSINAKVATIDTTAKNDRHFDYQITDAVDKIVIGDLKNELRDAGDLIVDVASDIGVSLSTDDVTDPDETQI